MSAVIWCGIVAVWAFFLIPTWVRRGDHHWHRPLTNAAAGARARVLRRSRSVGSTMGGAAGASSPTSPDPVPVSAASASTAAAVRKPAGAVRRAVTKRVTRRVSRRVSRRSGAEPAVGAVRQPSRSLQVRRARRLVALLALVLITGVAALLDPGRALVLHLLVDAVTIGYLVHLRQAALQRRRELARARRSLAARRRWERSTAAERTQRIEGWPAGHRAAAVAEMTSASAPAAPTAPAVPLAPAPSSGAAQSVQPVQPVYERMRRQRAAVKAQQAAADATSVVHTVPAMIDLSEPGTPLVVDMAAAEAAEGHTEAHPGKHSVEAVTEELAVSQAG